MEEELWVYRGAIIEFLRGVRSSDIPYGGRGVEEEICWTIYISV